MTDLIRGLIVDDHFVVRQGVATVLVARNGMAVVGEAATGREGVELARTLQPDVILMDLLMPEMDGLQAIAAINQEDPDARILVLSSYSDSDKIAAAIQAGALGYLLKESTRDELLEAVRRVATGQLSLPPALALKVLQELPRAPQLESPAEILTERELDVLQGIARGLSNQEIARELSIGANTVRSHVSSLLSKLECANRTQLALLAREKGLTGPGR